ncbi:hypothetical protein [Burkholderia anthina]|uniref:hypothetical protein n=1 Tax=Burkholderia anthina TaxID=179879 RepID=UPI00272D0AC0
MRFAKLFEQQIQRINAHRMRINRPHVLTSRRDASNLNDGNSTQEVDDSSSTQSDAGGENAAVCDEGDAQADRNGVS